MHAMLNAYWEPLSFEIPPADGGHLPWKRWIDTFRDAPEDICEWSRAPEVEEVTYQVQPRSVVVLVARHAGGS